MREVTQTILMKSGETRLGNCMQAAVASMLDLPLEDVPHFAEYEGDWFAFMTDWGTAQGYDVTRNRNKRGLAMMLGASPRGEFNHTVVARNGTLVWDPHPSRKGLLDGLYSGGVLYPGYADFIHFERIKESI